MLEKWNSFHACITLQTVRCVLAKLINIWIEINSCWSGIQDLKIPSKSSSFARETDLSFWSWSLELNSQYAICISNKALILHFVLQASTALSASTSSINGLSPNVMRSVYQLSPGKDNDWNQTVLWDFYKLSFHHWLIDCKMMSFPIMAL